MEGGGRGHGQAAPRKRGPRGGDAYLLLPTRRAPVTAALPPGAGHPAGRPQPRGTEQNGGVRSGPSEPEDRRRRGPGGRTDAHSPHRGGAGPGQSGGGKRGGGRRGSTQHGGGGAVGGAEHRMEPVRARPGFRAPARSSRPPLGSGSVDWGRGKEPPSLPPSSPSLSPLPPSLLPSPPVERAVSWAQIAGALGGSLHLGLQAPRSRGRAGLTAGGAAVPRRSQTSAPVRTGPGAVVCHPDVPAQTAPQPLHPPQPVREGGAGPSPPARPPRCRSAPSASILAFVSSLRETAAETRVQPAREPGVGEGATSLLPSVSFPKRGRGHREPSGAPPPTRLHPTSHTARGDRGSPSAPTRPPQLPVPTTGTPPPTPTPTAVRTGPATRVFPTRFTRADAPPHASAVHRPSPSAAGRPARGASLPRLAGVEQDDRFPEGSLK